jgi:hypothetical protein
MEKIFTSQCRFSSSWVEHAASIFMQVFMIFMFLTIFFFVYVVKVEKEQFVEQINFIVDNLMQDWGRILPVIMPLDRKKSAQIKEDVILDLNRTLKTQREKAGKNTDIQDKNEQVKKLARFTLISVGIFVGVGFLALFLLHFCVRPIHHFWENLALIGVIGLVEYLFLQDVASNYRAADPNKVKLYILESVQEFAEQQPVNRPYPIVY